MAETVLVTGGTGYVGGWCIRELLERGYNVRTTLRSLSRDAELRAAVGADGSAADRLTFFIADLMDDTGWAEAVAGCDYVLHVASPLGSSGADDAALLGPAREGTLRVLRFATEAGVKRVVMTSAAATARAPRDSGIPSDETVWADPADPQFDGYRRSKILSEKAAWDFMAQTGSATTLTTILPVAVFGPLLSSDNKGSVQIISNLLTGRMPQAPRLGFAIVDVRDLADIHIRAMTAPEAAGQRFIASGDFMWMEEIAKALRAALGPAAAKAPTRKMPDTVFKLAAAVTPQLRFFLPDLGRRNEPSSEKARRLLGFSPRPAATTVVECAESLLALD